jgi:AraC-like DNA-binding protein
MTSVSRHWSTAHAPEGKALEYWTEVVSEAIFKSHVDSADLDDTVATLTQTRLGPLNLHRIVHPSEIVRRTRQDVLQTKAALFSLIYVKAGGIGFTHYGRSIELGPGDCVLADSSETAESRARCGESWVLSMPSAWLGRWMPDPQQGVARPIRGASPWGAALVAAMSAAASGEAEHLAAPLVPDTLGMTLALAAGGGDVGTGGYSRKLFLRLRETLRDRGHECGLDPGTVAAEHHISPRYLQMIFAAAGTTFSAELWDIRLSRATDLLRSQRFAALSVADIGWRCGFADPSHFARRFKRRFGASPTLYRTIVAGAA